MTATDSRTLSRTPIFASNLEKIPPFFGGILPKFKEAEISFFRSYHPSIVLKVKTPCSNDAKKKVREGLVSFNHQRYLRKLKEVVGGEGEKKSRLF